MGRTSKGFLERLDRERIALHVARGKWTNFADAWPDMRLPHYVRTKDGQVILAQRYDERRKEWLPDELNCAELLDWTPSSSSL